MIVLDFIQQSLKGATVYNRHELAPPRVILWTDEERLWEGCIGAIRERYPMLWTLGAYEPEKVTGPAAWLRYQLETERGYDTPVIYLPGVGRAAFRSADQCPEQARHLFALQFQGQFWTQKNGKDWTPFAYFISPDGRLELDLAGDQETKQAIQECLPTLLSVEVETLQGKRLDATAIRKLVFTDPARTLLRWIGEPEKVRLELQQSGSEWSSFREICRKEYLFDPDKDGAMTAAEKLTGNASAWAQIWQLYKDAPISYRGVKEALETLDSNSPRPLIEPSVEYKPRHNREAEARLEAELLGLESMEPKQAAASIKALAYEHAHRARWVWDKFDEVPLAHAIDHLRVAAEIAQASGNPATWEALADYYANTGWKVDRAVGEAFSAARKNNGAKAVTAAIRSFYPAWLEKYAILAQDLAATYPNTGPKTARRLPVEEGTVYLFVDGLRMDLGRALEEKLASSGLTVALAPAWSALPTVTATAKRAWMPLAEKLGGPLEGVTFEPREKANSKALTHPRFKQLMAELNIAFLESESNVFASGCAWTECGAFDKHGHNDGAKLAWRVDEELAGVGQRVNELLETGWKKVVVVTDHGWLLVPGGLPTATLPKHLTQTRWGRCAIPAAGAQHGYARTPWFWDGAEEVVLAPNISCFASGMEYAHGGLTLQEALIPALTVIAGKAGGSKAIVLKDLKWAGLRLIVVFEGAEGFLVDVRAKPADAASTFAKPVPCAVDGAKTSLLVTDDDAIGAAAVLVVVDQNNQPIFKKSVVIGED